MSRRNTFIIPQTLDADASAYIATGITNATEITAINQFFLDLKSYSIFTKFYHLHLLVAGDSTTRKFNLVNPLNTNVAFRLSFVGGWTHGSTGSTPNGTTGYADTFLVPANVVNLNDVGVDIMSDTNSAGSASFIYDFGVTDGGTRFEGALGFLNTLYPLLNQLAVTTIANTNTQKLFSINRVGASSTIIYSNGALLGSIADASTTRPGTFSNYLAARNASGTAQFFSNRRYRLFSVHTSFTATQAANFNTAVQTLMTSLGI